MDVLPFSVCLNQLTHCISSVSGYMAPEYAMDGVFSTKSDVYSFGILVLEIISGQLNTASICLSYDGRSLIEHVRLSSSLSLFPKSALNSGAIRTNAYGELHLQLIFETGMEPVV